MNPHFTKAQEVKNRQISAFKGCLVKNRQVFGGRPEKERERFALSLSWTIGSARKRRNIPSMAGSR
jgi:hypothetical protein